MYSYRTNTQKDGNVEPSQVTVGPYEVPGPHFAPFLAIKFVEIRGLTRNKHWNGCIGRVTGSEVEKMIAAGWDAERIRAEHKSVKDGRVSVFVYAAAKEFYVAPSKLYCYTSGKRLRMEDIKRGGGIVGAKEV